MYKHNRLHGTNVFKVLRGRSVPRWRHPLAVLTVTTNDLSVSRFGFSASRRVGNAVERNRAKRLLREVIRLHIDEIKPGWDCLLVARNKTVTATYSEVESAVMHLLSQADLVKDD